MKKVYVKDFCNHCMTRSKGKKFYEYLHNLNTQEIEIDFSGIEYVSASFLDESVWRLAEEYYKIIIHDPDKVIKNKLEKIKTWKNKSINMKNIFTIN